MRTISTKFWKIDMVDIKVIENEKDKVRVEVDDLTLVSLLNENLWQGKVDYAAWKRGHPLLEKPTLLVGAKDAKKSIVEAAEQVSEDAKALKKKFISAMKD